MYNILGIIGLGSILLLLLGGLVAIVCYFLSCLAIMKMADNAGIEEKWLAWIPVGNFYIIGKLINKIEFGDKTFEQAELILPAIFVISLILRRIGFIGSLANFMMWLVTLYSFYMLYKRYAPDKVTKYMIISVFVPVIGSSVILHKIKAYEPQESLEAA